MSSVCIWHVQSDSIQFVDDEIAIEWNGWMAEVFSPSVKSMERRREREHVRLWIFLRVDRKTMKCNK